MEHLKTLSLAANNVKGLNYVFSERLDIPNIILTDNFIRIIPPVLPHMPEVLHLSLDNCGIESLPPHAFHNLQNLQTLSLTHNVLTTIDPLAFASLPKLRNLALSNTELREWPLPALQGLSLDNLWIAHNFLNFLPRLANTSVGNLDVSYNLIEGWADDSLFQCEGLVAEKSAIPYEGKRNCVNGSWVVKLNLQGNMLRTLTKDMRQSLDALHEVDIRANRINCADCETPLVQQWMRRTAVAVAEPFTCYEPVSQKDKLVIEIAYDPNTCLGPYRKLLAVAVPIGVVVGVTVLVAAVMYLYRTEVAYLRHLIRIRHSTKQQNRQSKECVHDAFVCYSGKDRKWVLRELTPLLEHGPERFRLCLFDRDFRLGTHIISNIVDAIDHSAKVVVVLSHHFIESKWCAWELEMANHKLFGEDRSFLVLIELEPLRREGLPRLLRFLMDTRPLVRWPGAGAGPLEVEAAAGQLRRALGPSLSSRPSTSAPGGGSHSQHTPHETTPLLL